MSWIDEEFDRMEELRAADAPPPTEQEVASAVARWWQWLGEALRRNVKTAQEHGLSAELSEPGANHYRIASPESNLAVDLVLDQQIRGARFDYASSNGSSTPPEGGIITLRPRGRNRIAAYISDQQLHEQDLMRTLLKPVLFPTLPSDEA